MHLGLWGVGRTSLQLQKIHLRGSVWPVPDVRLHSVSLFGEQLIPYAANPALSQAQQGCLLVAQN
jgi:hypothetical protein